MVSFCPDVVSFRPKRGVVSSQRWCRKDTRYIQDILKEKFIDRGCRIKAARPLKRTRELKLSRQTRERVRQRRRVGKPKSGSQTARTAADRQHQSADSRARQREQHRLQGRRRRPSSGSVRKIRARQTEQSRLRGRRRGAPRRQSPRGRRQPDRAESSALSPVRIITSTSTSTRPTVPSRSPSSRPVSVIIARARTSRAERTATARQ